MYLEHLTYLISSLSSLVDTGERTDCRRDLEAHRKCDFVYLARGEVQSARPKFPLRISGPRCHLGIGRA